MTIILYPFWSQFISLTCECIAFSSESMFGLKKIKLGLHVSFFLLTCEEENENKRIRKRMRTRKDEGRKEGGKDVSLKNRGSYPFWFWSLRSEAPSKIYIYRLFQSTLENSKWNFSSQVVDPQRAPLVYWNFVTDLWLRWDHLGDFGDIGSNKFQPFRVCCQSIS